MPHHTSLTGGGGPHSAPYRSGNEVSKHNIVELSSAQLSKDREEADRVTRLLILVAVVHFAIDYDEGTPAYADEGLVAAVEEAYAHGKIWDDCGPTTPS